jgi:hypothetical protein
MMAMLTRGCFVILACLLAAAVPAAAQSTYVSASVFGDIARSSHPSANDRTGSGGGEAVGFALRIGTPLGSSWGVELEFARPGEIEQDGVSGQLTWLQQQLPPTAIGSPTVILPIVAEVRSSDRYTTLAASLWYQQQLTGRVALAYLGGLSFGRTAREFHVNYGGIAPAPLPFVPPPIRTEFIAYGVRPLAGFESRISLTDHAQLVPGIRLHAASDLWLVRPSVGLAWSF